MSVLSVLKLILYLVILPMCTGLIPYRILPLHKRGLSVVLLTGYLISFSLFEIVAIPCMLTIVYGSFYTCARIYTAVLFLAAAAGIAIGGPQFLRREKKVLTLRQAKQWEKEQIVLWGIFLCIVAFQLYQAATHLFFDGDDAYYVVESLLAQQAGVMNTILPYTGTSTTLDVRHALSVLTMWIAFIAQKSGIHATIVSHTVMPFVFLPLTYLTYFQIAKLILFNRAKAVNTVNTSRSKKEPGPQLLQPVFMIFMAVFVMFGNVSIYTPETFLMMRTWQGKSLVANLILPLMLWLLLWISKDVWKEWEVRDKDRYTPWILLALVNMTAGICSSMGVVLAGAFFCIGIAFVIVIKKKWTLIVATMASFLPSIVYVLLYLLLPS